MPWPTVLAPGDPRHGSENGYNHFRCRCKPCGTAHAKVLQSQAKGRNTRRRARERRKTQARHNPEPFLNDEWIPDSACSTGVDPEIFFPIDSKPESAQAAKAVCGVCPVVVKCLEHALRNDLGEGIFGGLTPEEREDLPSLTGGSRGISVG